MRERGCRQRGSKQGAYRRAARSAAYLASGHMIVWPRHSARVDPCLAWPHDRVAHVEPPRDRVAHVEPPVSRGHGDARVAMRAPGGHMVVWPRQAASRTATTRAPGGHMVVWPRQAASRMATTRRVAASRCQGYPGCPSPTGRAPWCQRAPERGRCRGTVEHPLLASARSPRPAGWSTAGGLASRREAARPQQREARVFRCPVFRCPWPLPHAHRNIGGIARTRALWEGSRLAIGPIQAAAGKQMGKRS